MNDEIYPDTHHDNHSKTILGFWLYLLTDFMVFATFFATFAVLHKNTFDGPPPSALFNINYTLVQSFFLLAAAFTSGLAGIAIQRKSVKGTTLFFAITFVLGFIFTWMMFSEMRHLVDTGNSWTRSAYLSAFFTLVGMLGAHMIIALLWTILLLTILWRDGMDETSTRRLTCLKLFWQFINVVWIFIFAIVYLLGVRNYV